MFDPIDDIKKSGLISEIIRRLGILETNIRKIMSTVSAGGGSSGRELLTAARTYYVRTDGSDSNNGLANTSGGAFLTIQKAIDVASAFDNGGYNITIQVADGTYTGLNVLKTFVGSGKIIIQGNNSTPANVIISVTTSTAAGCFSGDSILGTYRILDMELRSTTNGNCIEAGRGAKIEYGNIRFGTCAANHIRSFQQGSVQCVGNYSIVGNSFRHWFCVDNGILDIPINTKITLSGTPAFSTTFAGVDRMGFMKVNTLTFSGSATGVRYIANGNGLIFTNGGGATYLPGNSAGTTDGIGSYT